MLDIVAGVRSVRSRGGVARENGFLKKYRGGGVGKSLSARAGVGMESNQKMSGPSWARPGAAFALSLK